MYTEVAPHESFETSHGEVLKPVATLQSGATGLCHVTKDEDCYVCYLFSEYIGFVPTEYLFPELHAVLAKLPLVGA